MHKYFLDSFTLMLSTEIDVKEVIQQLSQTNILPSQEFMSNITKEKFQQILDFYIFTKCPKTPKRIAYFFELITESLENDRKVLLHGIEYLKEHFDVRHKNVRRNVIILTSILFEKINIHINKDGMLEMYNSENHQNDQEFMKKIIIKTSERLFDVDRIVRIYAVQILSNFQNFFINQKTCIKRIFKDLLRHDPIAEVRNTVMKFLVYENCVIEKIKDQSILVRQNFYRICLPHIKLKNISTAHRSLILEKSLSERDFNAVPLLKSKIYEDYDLPKEFANFVQDFFILNTVDYDEKNFEKIEENRKNLTLILGEIFKELSLKIEFFDSAFYENLNLNTSLLLNTYFSYMENMNGRESLKLVDFEYFTNILYLKVKNIAVKQFNTEDLYFIIVLFQLTTFYDICDPNTSKHILSTMYKFLKIEITQNDKILDKLIENGIILASGTDRITFNNFLGSLITKNKHNYSFLYRICKYVMIRVKPFEILHDAIIDELIIPYLENTENEKEQIEILFHYIIGRIKKDPECLLHNNAESKEMSSLDISSLTHYVIEMSENDIEILTDLYMFLETKRELIGHKILLFYRRNKSNLVEVPMITSLSKCLLIDPEKFQIIFQKLVTIYFESENEYIQQYLTLFIQEFTLKNPQIVTAQIFKILPKLKKLAAQKIFVDQIIIWVRTIDEDKKKCFSENILLSALIFFIAGMKICSKSKNETSSALDKKTISDNLIAHISLFEFIITRIKVNSNFSASKIKQMIYCLGIIAKIAHSMRENIEIGNLSNHLMVYNDNMPMSIDQKEEIDQMLAIESE